MCRFYIQIHINDRYSKQTYFAIFHIGVGKISFLNHVLVDFPHIHWSADKCLTNQLLRKKNLIFSVFKCLQCIYYYHGQVQAINIPECTAGKRCLQPSSHKPATAGTVKPLQWLSFRYCFINFHHRMIIILLRGIFFKYIQLQSHLNILSLKMTMLFFS